jgi:hypothetical protein
MDTDSAKKGDDGGDVGVPRVVHEGFAYPDIRPESQPISSSCRGA